MDKLDFKKSNLKSPIGDGLFDLYINDKHQIIYKKIKKNIDNISIYKNIIYNLKNNPILSKYILKPENIQIKEDGSYFSMFVKNGIRLYDIDSKKVIDNNILIKIKESVKYLQKDLNEYVKNNTLNGDWALHNLIYCLDTNKIYNVDLEGFYTYPFIHNNGNCDIKYCNERFNKLLIIIEKKLEYFTLILWNPTIFQSEKILQDIPNIIEKNEIIIPKEKLHEYIFDIYKLDTRCSHNTVLPPKIQLLKEYEDRHLMVKFKIDNPTYSNNICNQVVELKERIRKKYKSNIKNYIKDIMIHMADNFEQSKYIWEKNVKLMINSIKKKEKVAICLSGELRTFNKTYENFYKNIINILKKKFEVDIFMFIWKTENKNNVEKALEIYKPKKYIIKDDFKFKLPYFCENMYFYKGRLNDIILNFSNSIKMFYGIYECFNLIESNDYNYVIRNRYDNLFNENININTFNNNLYISNGHYFYLNGKPTNINDSFAYGPYKIMSEYSNFINMYESILLQIKNRELKEDCNYLYKSITPTLLFKYYISHFKNIKYLETNIKYGILRTNNKLTIYQNDQKYGYEGFMYKIKNIYYEYVTFILWKSNNTLLEIIKQNFKKYEITIDDFDYNKEKRYNLMKKIYFPNPINKNDPRISYNDKITLITIKYYNPDYKYIFRSKKYHPCIDSIICFKTKLRKKFKALEFHVSDFLNESNDCLLSLKNIKPEYIIINFNNLYGICHNGKTTDDSRSGNFTFKNIKNSYNYKYVIGDKDDYHKYCQKKLGHSVEKFEKLLKNFNIETYNNFNHITIYKYDNDNYIINDGMHRASILYSLGYRHITAKIIEKPMDWYIFKFKINKTLLKTDDSHNEIYHNFINELSKNNIYYTLENISFYHKVFNIKNNEYKKYLNEKYFILVDDTYKTISSKFEKEEAYYIRFKLKN